MLIVERRALRILGVALFNRRQRFIYHTVVRRTENLISNSSKCERILSARTCFGVSDSNV